MGLQRLQTLKTKTTTKMEKSETISKISKALLMAQMQMGNAVKDSTNPFFKSKYADLNSVREACIPYLNTNGITALQPMVSMDGKNYINTVLLHESGEWISSFTEIVYSKQNDAQAQGSGITYARRYGLQSMVNIGSEDDDGNKASEKQQEKKTFSKPFLNEKSDAFFAAKKAISEGTHTIEDVEKKYQITAEILTKLTAK